MLTKPVKKYRVQTLHTEIFSNLKFCNNKCNVAYLNEMMSPPEWYPIRTNNFSKIFKAMYFLLSFLIYHFG